MFESGDGLGTAHSSSTVVRTVVGATTGPIVDQDILINGMVEGNARHAAFSKEKWILGNIPRPFVL